MNYSFIHSFRIFL